MERLTIMLDDAKFDEAVHGPEGGEPSLPEAGDLAVYVKKKATEGGKAGAVITFTVQLPDGSMRRVQSVTTVANLMTALAILKGWETGGHLK